MPDYEEIIQKSKENVNALNEKLRDLDQLHQDIIGLKNVAGEIPVIFNQKFQELVKLSEDYTNTLGTATKKYLDGNNNLFTTKLEELADKIKEFEKEITRLVNTDFPKLFKDLQKVFIDQTREDLAKELKRFEVKSIDLQTKIDELKKQIERLERIDLDRHFDKLQKILAEIFGAINAINLTFTNVIQTMTVIVQSLGNIETAIQKNHKEVNEFIEGKMKSVLEQNELIKKETRANRIIQIIGLAIILIILIYVAVKQ